MQGKGKEGQGWFRGYQVDQVKLLYIKLDQDFLILSTSGP